MTLENSYWGHKGKYQDVYNSIKALIPDSGESEDPNIELLRCGSNIYYDCYNNGGCNLGARFDQIETILKYRDRIVEKIGLDLWNQFKNTIVKHRDQLDDPDGYEDEVDCYDCGGGGQEDCESCNGSEVQICLDCNGSGEDESADAMMARATAGIPIRKVRCSR